MLRILPIFIILLSFSQKALAQQTCVGKINETSWPCKGQENGSNRDSDPDRKADKECAITFSVSKPTSSGGEGGGSSVGGSAESGGGGGSVEGCGKAFENMIQKAWEDGEAEWKRAWKGISEWSGRAGHKIGRAIDCFNGCNNHGDEERHARLVRLEAERQAYVQLESATQTDLDKSNVQLGTLSSQNSFSQIGNEIDISSPEIDAHIKSIPSTLARSYSAAEYPYQTARYSANGKNLYQARQYRNYVNSKVATMPDADREIGMALVESADAHLQLADDFYRDNDQTFGDHMRTIAVLSLDAAIDFMPGVSFAKDVVSIATGKNPVTGEQLTNVDIGIISAGILVPAAISGGGKVVAKVSVMLARHAEAFPFAKRVLNGLKESDSFLARVMRKTPCGTGGGGGCSPLGEITGDLAHSAQDQIKVMGPKKFKEILETPNGSRPMPETYLPKEYIERHLKEFDDGASLLIPKKNLDQYGRELIGFPDNTQFVIPKPTMDELLKKANGDLNLIEKELGIPAGRWQGQEISRIDIPKPRDHGLRMPSGNEAGANEQWLPGGKLPTGLSEAVTNRIPLGGYVEGGIF